MHMTHVNQQQISSKFSQNTGKKVYKPETDFGK